jgi:membrane associated rhomboid family serine protease
MPVTEKKSSRRIFFGSDNDALLSLIIANAVIFVIIAFIKSIYLLSDIDMLAFNKNVIGWFVVPPDVEKLAERPWTLLTYMFSHVKVMHFVSNMLWLWAFGYILQDLTGNRKLIPIYIYGGLAGAVYFLLAVELIPKIDPATAAPLVGAGASIMAVAVATTLVAPDYRIFPMINGGIPLWVLTMVYALVDFASITYGEPAIYISHIAGAGIGFFYIYFLRKGHDWGEWMVKSYEWLNDLFKPGKSRKSKPAGNQIFYNTRGKQPFKKTPNLTQQKVDEILDKINQKGYHFLTDEEKELLKRASEEDL